MILNKIGYVAPASLDEATALLERDRHARAIAGGSELLTQLKRNEAHPTQLVDLRRIDALRGNSMRQDGRLRLGALTTLTDLLTEGTIRASYQYSVLSDAAAHTGDVQFRNRATVGGEIAAARQGSDLLAALLVLNASVRTTGSVEKRVIPIADLLAGHALLAHDELIVAADIGPAEQGSAYAKFTDRANLRALCGVAVTLALSAGGRLSSCRVAVTGALPFPRRMPAMEEALTGQSAPLRVPEPAASAFITTQAASAEYRAHLVKTLAERALATAVERASNT